MPNTYCSRRRKSGHETGKSSRQKKRQNMKERKFWNEEKETLPLQKLQKLQNEGLQNAVDWAYKKTRFYRNLFD
jgi:hypothetical protein